MVLLDLNTLFQGIATTKPISGAVAKIIGLNIVVGVIIALVLGVIRIGYIFYKDEVSAISDGQMTVEDKYREIIRLLFNATLLVMYPVWIVVISGFIIFVNSITKLNTEYAQEMEVYAEKILFNSGTSAMSDDISPEWIKYVLQNKDDFSTIVVKECERIAETNDIYATHEVESLKQESSTNIWNRIYNELYKIQNSILSIPESLLVGVFSTLALFVRTMVIIFIKYGWIFTIVVGPLAIAVSFWYSDMITHWFKIYINAGLAITTLNIIDHLLYGFSRSYWDIRFNDPYNPVADDNIVFSLMMCGAYLMVWKITSWWAGKAAVGQLAGKSMIFGATTIGAAVGGFMISKGMGGSAMKNIFDTVNKSVQNNSPE